MRTGSPNEIGWMIFDERIRDDARPATHTESTFAFMNRCADPVFGAIRELLEEWVRTYPSGNGDDEDRAELIARFRSGDNTDYRSAFWELYLHEVLRRVGYRLTPHPPTPTGKRVDFLAVKGATRFYLEAALVTGPGLTGQADIPGLGDVYDKIDAAFDSDFWVKVVAVVPGPSAPPRAAIVTPLERWLRDLDWQDEWDNYGERDLPSTTIDARGWKIAVRAHPKAPEIRGDPSFRMIGIYPNVGGISLADRDILEKLSEKAYRYGQLDAPYAIAVWSLATPATSDDFQHALFGGWPISDSGRSAGLWRRNGQARARRVSAVLGAVTFSFGGEHSIASTWPKLWVNPWADQELDLDDLPWPTTLADLASQTFATHPGSPESPADFFGLSPDWPGEPFRDPVEP
jgi:hypothetical protein